MYKGLKVVLIAPVLDEEVKIGEVVRRAPRDIVDEVLVVDDGSKDRSPEVARAGGATVLAMGATIGVGAALRAGFVWAKDAGSTSSSSSPATTRTRPRRSPACSTPSSPAPTSCRGRAFWRAAAPEGCRCIATSPPASTRCSSR